MKTMPLARSADFWSGLLFAGIGALAASIALRYHHGDPAELGPGDFPIWLGVTLIVLGILLVARAVVTETEAVATISLRIPATVVSALAAFAILLERAGFVIASLAFLLIASRTASNFRTVPLLLFSIGIVAAAAMLFRYVLGVPLPLRPALGAFAA